MSTNLTRIFLPCRHALNYITQHPIHPSIINISSLHHQIPSPHFVHYPPTKAAPKLLTQTLPLQYPPKKIPLNTIPPPPIHTPINP
ncbi:SDR family NAD(P)-dependent oxidoreductase, partial [Bacillus altitudinis]|uniref:SDR family NAD(P)-dependent oxidoreductase n=1 Tax=Bacillus altitudinis TaxID=293387 RepID=UPI002354BE36